MLIIIAITLVLNLGFSESCTTNGAYFPDNGAMAIAVLKGSLNGNPVQGTITFTQPVNKDFTLNSILENKY